MRQSALVVMLLVTMGLVGSKAQQTIEWIDVGAAFSGPSVATAVNGKGTVVGSATTDTGTIAFVWTWDRRVRAIVRDASARDINNKGQVVGSVYCADFSCMRYGFVWSASVPLRNLGTFHPHAINEAGDMAGWCGSTHRPCAIVAGTRYVLAPGSGVATGINETGAVSGFWWDETASRSRPFTWSRATGRRALDISPYNHGYAEAINDYGQVVGALAQELSESIAVRWRSSGRFLAPYNSNDATWARAVENHGWVVGHGGSLADDERPPYPILWRNGILTRLPVGPYLGGAGLDINESGVMTGHVTTGDGESRAAVWRFVY